MLAASWLDTLSLTEIVSELQKGLEILAAEEDSDLPDRMRSIHVVMEHAWQMMSAAEQSAFMKMSLFIGGFTREAAEAVCGANLRILQSLVKKSLLGRDVENGRYTIHELLRQYAAEKLTTSGQEAATREAHARYFAQLLGPLHEALYANTATQATEIIAAEYENGILAWKWGVEQLDETVVIGIVFPLGVYSAWYLLEHMINQFDDAYDRLEGRLQPRSWFMFLLVRLAVYVYVRHSSPKRGNAEQLIALLPGVRDQFGTDSEGLWTRYYIGMVLRAAPDAREIVLEAIDLAKKVENVWVERGAHFQVGSIERDRQNLEAALYHYKSAYTLSKATGNLVGLANDCSKLAYFYFYHRQAYALARQYFAEAHPLFVKISGSAGIIGVSSYLAIFDFDDGNLSTALQRSQESIAYGRQAKDFHSAARAIRFHVTLLSRVGRYREALTYLALPALRRAELDDKGLFKNVHSGLQGMLLAALGQVEDERPFLTNSFPTVAAHWHWRLLEMQPYYVGFAHLLISDGQPEEAVEMTSQIMETSFGPMWSKAVVFQELLDRARERLSETTYKAAWERGKSLTHEQVLDRLKAQANA